LHALTTINGCDGNLGCVARVINSTAETFAANIGNIVSALQLAGATSIVVWDVPDVGDAPVAHALGVSGLATAIASSMNSTLPSTIGGDPNVTLFDAFGLLNDVIGDPSAFGLANVTDACAQFTACDPSQYLFWDGIHPTSAAEPIIADAILSLIDVPEPSALSFLAFALVALCLLATAVAAARRKAGHCHCAILGEVHSCLRRERLALLKEWPHNAATTSAEERA
jgi:phospholipase/lecithinase/hemolysin